MDSPAVAEARRAFANHDPTQLDAIIRVVSRLESRANDIRLIYIVASLAIGATILFVTFQLNLFGDPKGVGDKWGKAVGAFLALWSPLFALWSPKVEFKSADYEAITKKKPLPVDLAGINRALALPSERFDKTLKLFDAGAKALAVYLLL